MTTTPGLPTTARDLMTTRVFTLQADASVFEAAGLLLRHRYSGAPVLEGKLLVGLISEQDLVRALECVEDDRCPDAAVRDYMSTDLVTIGPDEGLFELSRVIRTHGVRRLPVVAGGELVGLISRKDVLQALHRHALQIRRR